MRNIILTMTILLTLMAGAAHADSFGLGFAGTFNAFVFGNFTSSSSDTQGRMAVGGNASLGSYSVGDKLTPGQYEDVLVVGGDLTYTSGRVYGRALVGGSATLGHQNVADGGVYTNQNMPFSFASEQSRLTSLSSSLSGRSATGSVTNEWGGLTLVGNGSSAVQVFNIDGSTLMNSWGMSLSNISDDTTVIINVSGLTAGMTNMNMEALSAFSSTVLFNFYEATDLDLWGVAVQGSILAPLADVEDASGALWGTLIAKSFSGGMELEHNPFTGNVSDTPIPAAAWLLGSGVAGLLGLRRRLSRR